VRKKKKVREKAPTNGEMFIMIIFNRKKKDATICRKKGKGGKKEGHASFKKGKGCASKRVKSQLQLKKRFFRERARCNEEKKKHRERGKKKKKECR